MPSISGRPRGEREDVQGGGNGRGSRGRVPVGALVLLVALTLVFGYGVYLKATSVPKVVIKESGHKARRTGTRKPSTATASTGHVAPDDGGAAARAGGDGVGTARPSDSGSESGAAGALPEHSQRPLIPDPAGPPSP